MGILNLNQAINSLPPYAGREVMRKLFGASLGPMRSVLLATGAIAIKAGASALAKTVNVIQYMVGGQLATKAAGDLAALSGTVTADAFNVYVFSVTAGGTFVTRMGLEATTLAGVKFPPVPDTEAVVGFVIINPTGTGNFVGGTTPLDDATVVPNAVYVNTPYPFNPNVR